MRNFTCIPSTPNLIKTPDASLPVIGSRDTDFDDQSGQHAPVTPQNFNVLPLALPRI